MINNVRFVYILCIFWALTIELWSPMQWASTQFSCRLTLEESLALTYAQGDWITEFYWWAMVLPAMLPSE